MKAVLFEQFREAPKVTTVADPTPEAHGVVLKVEATGVCRSDWHGWMGHDSDIELPHPPAMSWQAWLKRSVRMLRTGPSETE